MKLKKFHMSNMGKHGTDLPIDNEGYVTCHDSGRYHNATDEQLDDWSENRLSAVRAAVRVERVARMNTTYQ